MTHNFPMRSFKITVLYQKLLCVAACLCWQPARSELWLKLRLRLNPRASPSFGDHGGPRIAGSCAAGGVFRFGGGAAGQRQCSLCWSRRRSCFARTRRSFSKQRGAGGGQADLVLRGGTFEQALVLLNGFRIDDSQTAHHDLDLPIPLDAMESIEVLHGAGSTLHGADALSGVVDFLTAAPSANLAAPALGIWQLRLE